MSELARHVSWNEAWSCCELTGVWIISCAARGAAARGSEIISWPLRWRPIKAGSQWSVYLTNYRAQLINDTRPLQFLANHRRPSAAVSSLINTEAASRLRVFTGCFNSKVFLKGSFIKYDQSQICSQLLWIKSLQPSSSDSISSDGLKIDPCARCRGFCSFIAIMWFSASFRIQLNSNPLLCGAGITPAGLLLLMEAKTLMRNWKRPLHRTAKLPSRFEQTVAYTRVSFGTFGLVIIGLLCDVKHLHMWLLNMTALWNDTNELWTHSSASIGYSDNWETAHLWWTCPLCVQSLLRRRRTEKLDQWHHGVTQTPVGSGEAFSSLPVQIFILFPLWPTLCHTFHFLLLSLIPLTVYVQIETAD